MATTPRRLDVPTLEGWLWDAACQIRGPLDAPKFNSDRGEVDSNPYSIIALKGRKIATDAGGNDLLRIGRRGHIRTLATFPTRMVDFNGQPIPMQAVPTGVVKGPDGAHYVGQLTGFPFPVGKARVYRPGRLAHHARE